MKSGQAVEKKWAGHLPGQPLPPTVSTIDLPETRPHQRFPGISSFSFLQRALLALSVLALSVGLLQFTTTAAIAQSYNTIIYGPNLYTRSSGTGGNTSGEYEQRFNLPAGVTGPYLVRINNGAPAVAGSRNVTSAEIELNGVTVAQENDFSNNVTLIEKPLPNSALKPTQNEFHVQIKGNPNSRFTLTIYGTRPQTVPTQLTPNPLAIQSGNSGSLTATLSPAPTAAGSLSANSANTSIASVPASIAFAAGQTTVAVPVTANAAGTAVVTVTLNGSSAQSTVQVTAAPPTVTGIAPTSLSITQGSTGQVTVTISSAQTGATTVNLASSAPGNASVPASLSIPAGQLSAQATVTAVGAGNASITATLNGGSASSQITVTPAAAHITGLQPSAASLTLGAQQTLTVSIAPVQGSAVTVTLATSPSGILGIPATVTVAAGQGSASFTATGQTLGTATITASLNGTSAQSALQVTPPAPQLVSLLPASYSLVTGATAQFTLSINSAQTQAITIPLTLDHPATQQPALQAPAQITVAAGQTSANFTATALSVGTATLSATLGGVTKSAVASVIPVPAAVTALTPNPLPLQTGATGQFTVKINVAQQGATVINLAVTDTGGGTQANPAVAQIPATVTIPAGQLQAVFPVTGVNAGVATVSATVSAASGNSGVTQTAQVIVNLPPPEVASLSPLINGSPQANTTLNLPKGSPGTLRVTLTRAPSSAEQVTLSASGSAASVPASVTVAAGALYADFPVTSNAVGAATITAALNGGSATANINVGAAELLSLTLSPAAPLLYVPETQQMSASGTLTDGTTQSYTNLVTWSSTATASATVNASGQLTAIAAGSGNITATYAYTSITGQAMNVIQSTPFTVRVPQGLTLTANLGNPAVNPVTGNSVTFTVVSGEVDATQATIVALSQAGGGSFNLPATVTIPANQASATFSAVAQTPGAVTVTASATRRTPGNLSLTIAPAFTGVRIDAISPTSGAPGSSVTITGVGFDVIAANNTVTFTGGSGATSGSGSGSSGVPAVITQASATSLTVTVPATANSGPITVTRGTSSAQSQTFTIIRDQDFGLTVSPAALTVFQGSNAQASIKIASSGTRDFTGLASLTVTGLPTGVTAEFNPKTISAFQTGSLILKADSTAALTGGAGGGSPATITVTATYTQAGITLTKTGQFTLGVQSGQGVTGVKGRFVTPEGVGIPGVIARADINPTTQPTTTTDAAGNFLLTGLPAGSVTLRFDATPANPLYPIWPYSLIVEAGKIAGLEDWTINPPPTDDKFTPIQANATQDQVIRDARYPGLEIKIPAGTTITGWDGVAKSRIAVERLPLDKLPISPPPIATTGIYQLYFGTPMGGIPSQPIPVTLPNETDMQPGERTELWYFDGSPMGGTGEWKQGGTGTVSPDGKTIITDAGSGIPRFCGVCGMPCFKNNQSNGPNPAPGFPCSPFPISMGTGQETPEEGDLTIDGTFPIDISRSYNPLDPYAGIAGVRLSMGEGWTFGYDVTLLPFSAEQVRIVMPGNSRIDFANEGGQFKNTGDSRFEGAVINALGGADYSHEVVFQNSTKWRFRKIGLINYLVEVIDGNGNTLIVTRGANGRVTGLQAAQRSVAIEQGANGFISKITDGIGRSIRYTYNAANRIDTVTDTAGGVTTYGYAGDNEFPATAACPSVPGGQRIRTILYPGQTLPVDNVYGPGRRVLKQTLPDGAVAYFKYKLVGACVTHLSDPATRCAGAQCPSEDSWDNYNAGWRISGGTIAGTTVVRADGSQISYRFTGRSVQGEVIDAQGQSTKLAINPATNRVDAATDAIGRTTKFQYDAKGNVTKVTDPQSRVVDMDYDARWNRLSRIGALDQSGTTVSTQFQYDPNNGNLLSFTLPRGNSTAYTYTPQGQIATVRDALGNLSRFQYNAAGDLRETLDALGNSTTYEADAVGRAVSDTDAIGSTTRYTLNARDQITEAIDALGGRTTFAYDARGNLLSITDPMGNRVAQYTYDAMNRVTARTDAKGKASNYVYDVMGKLTQVTDRAGRVTKFFYDANQRLTRTEYADGNAESVTFDAAGRVASVTGPNGGIEYSFDGLDRVTSIKTPQGSLAYGYDASDRLVSMQTPVGVAGYTYDANGNVTRVAQNGVNVDFQYDLLDRRSRMDLPNGVAALYAYDARGQLTELRYEKAGTALERFTYRYDPVGNIIEKKRLLGDSRQESAFTAAYDNGNRLTSLTNAQGSTTLAYDDVGNLVSKTGPNGTTVYTWNVKGELAGIAGPNGTAAFKYDVLGRRIEKTINGIVTGFLYDGGQAVAEFGPNGAVTYLSGLGIDEVLARYAQSGNRMLLADDLGSVVAEIDANTGNVLGQTSYSPYGESSSTGDAGAQPLQYTGRENDATGLYYYRARYYDPLLKRFISEDPIGLAGGLNLYRYADGNPVSNNDPSGTIIPAAVAIAFQMCIRFPHWCSAAARGAAAAARWVVRQCFGMGPKGVGGGPRPAGAGAGGTGKGAGAPGGTTANSNSANGGGGGGNPSAAGGTPSTNTAPPGQPGPAKPSAPSSATGGEKQSGSYTNLHESGRTYSGKGSRERSQASGRRTEKETGDRHTATEWTPAPNSREAFKQESIRLDANGGAKSGQNHNKIESPGKHYRSQDGG